MLTRQKGLTICNSIDAKFLFGQSKVIPQDELRVEIGPWDGNSELSFYSVEDIPQNEKEEYQSIEDFGKKESSDDESQYAVLAIIIAIGIGAAKGVPLLNWYLVVGINQYELLATIRRRLGCPS